MSMQEMTSTTNLQELSTSSKTGQYTLWQVLGIWLAAGAPMWLLGWVVYPALSAGLPPTDAGLLRFTLLFVGLAWEFVLAMIILYREEGNIRLSTICRRFWLNHPVSPRTGETKKALWWWIMMYPFVKTEKGGLLKCMCLLPNRRAPWPFTRLDHSSLVSGGFVPLP